MGIIISSDVAKQYLLTDDAVEGFNTAVQNGQIRLALQILVELVDGIMQVLDYITQDEDDTEASVESAKAPEPIIEVKEEKVEDSKPEPVAKKTSTKEEKVQSKTEAE